MRYRVEDALAWRVRAGWTVPSGSDVHTVSVRMISIHVSLSRADTRASKCAVFCGDHRQINPQSSFGSPSMRWSCHHPRAGWKFPEQAPEEDVLSGMGF